MLTRILVPTLLAALLALFATAQAPTDPNKIGPIMTANQEINLLQTLIPLKLTKEQDTKLVAALKAAKAKSEAAYKKQEVAEADRIKKLEPKVMAAREKALKGEFPDDKYWDEWDKLNTQATVERTNLRIVNVRDIGAAIKDILTKEQYDKSVSQAKDAYKKIGGKIDDKVTDNQMFLYYVENVLMGDMTISLLETLAK